MPMSQGPRRSRVPKATCAGPLCEDPSPCRGLRPHHARRERVGTWETSSGPQSHKRSRAATGSREGEAVATGDMIIVRYADDIVIGFEHEADSRRFWDAMRERLREFSLTLHPDKTRLIEFGRHAAQT